MALFHSRQSSRTRSLGKRVWRSLTTPESVTLGLAAFFAQAADVFLDSKSMTLAVPTLLMGYALRSWQERSATKFDEEMANSVPGRPNWPKNPKNPDILISLFGGDEARGVGVEEDKGQRQFAEVLRGVVQQRLAGKYGIDDFKVGIAGLPETNLATERLEFRIEASGKDIGQRYDQEVAGSVLISGAGEVRASRTFSRHHFNASLGILTSPETAASSLFRAPLVAAKPHDISRAPRVPWKLRGFFRRSTATYNESFQNFTEAYAKRNNVSISVIDADDVLKGLTRDERKALFGKDDFYFSQHRINLLADQVADALVPMIIEDIEKRAALPQPLEVPAAPTWGLGEMPSRTDARYSERLLIAARIGSLAALPSDITELDPVPLRKLPRGKLGSQPPLSTVDPTRGLFNELRTRRQKTVTDVPRQNVEIVVSTKRR